MLKIRQVYLRSARLLQVSTKTKIVSDCLEVVLHFVKIAGGINGISDDDEGKGTVCTEIVSFRIEINAVIKKIFMKYKKLQITS